MGKDVATALGYANPSNAVSKHVDKEDKTSYLIQVSGSNYKTNTTFINESGLYSLILSSKLESAKRFKRWVTSEVLPCIRKHGGYIVPQNKNIVGNHDSIFLINDIKYSCSRFLNWGSALFSTF